MRVKHSRRVQFVRAIAFHLAEVHGQNLGIRSFLPAWNIGPILPLVANLVHVEVAVVLHPEPLAQRSLGGVAHKLVAGGPDLDPLVIFAPQGGILLGALHQHLLDKVKLITGLNGHQLRERQRHELLLAEVPRRVVVLFRRIEQVDLAELFRAVDANQGVVLVYQIAPLFPDLIEIIGGNCS